MHKLAFITLVAAAAIGVNAQSSSSTSSALPTVTVDVCTATCIAQAGQAAGCDPNTDLNCICSNKKFNDSATSCLKNCPSSDLPAALSIQSAACVAASASASLHPSHSNTAMGAVSINVKGLIGMGVAAISAIAGAALVL